MSVAADQRLLVVGVGDDGPPGLSAAMLARIQQAEVLAGGRRHLELFPEVSAERVVIAGDLAPLLDRLTAEAERRRVVVLASGDPCYFGVGPLLASRLGPERVEIVPGVSSVALAFARLGLGWQDATVVSAHGRPLDAAVGQARAATKLAVLTDPWNTPAAVAAALLAVGASDAEAWVFEHLGGAQERSVRTRLSKLVGQEFAELNVLVVPSLSWERVDVQHHCVGRFGLPESEYAHTASLITKPEIRAVTLSKLAPRQSGVLWDIGAGSGSVTIEATSLAPGLRAFAIERAPRQIELLRQNLAARPWTERIEVIDGEAPDALASLPAPDSVFVGGSGGKLREILGHCRERLRDGGRIVLNLVLLERLAEVVAWARDTGWTAEVVQVAVSRSTETAGQTRLQAENPVLIVTLTP